jgi:hypothetical protein
MRRLLLILIVAFLSGQVHAEKINYELVREVKAKRMGQHLIRYLSTLDSMCMGYFQSLTSDYSNNWSIDQTIALCELDGKSTATDFAYAGISEFEFKEKSIHMVISSFPLITGGEYLRNCTIKVNKGKFSPMSCDKPERAGD